MVEEVKLIEYSCSSCSTKFYTSKNDVTNCIFCDSTNLEKREAPLSGNISVLPFKIDSFDVVKDYKKKTKFNPLVPFKFKKKIDNIKKIYLPVYVTDITNEGNISFYGVNNNDLKNKYEIVQNIKFNYDDVVLKASSKIDDTLFEEINDYTFLELLDINNSNLDDSIYLVNDISFEDISNITKSKISKTSINKIKNSINHTKKKLKEDNTTISFNNNRKLLVPIYLINIKYKDKDYSYIMNGQTGSSYINIPIGVLETIIFSILLFGLVFLIGFLISYFL